MSKFVSPENSQKVQALMFGDYTEGARSNEELFFQKELSRYVPQLVGMNEADINAFMNYQRGIYLRGFHPHIGMPVASLNPSFVDGINSIKLSLPDGGKVYTRASVKENGYRMQVHRGLHGTLAFTRQFTPYDLRLFPELTETFKRLPVMIGDTELASAVHKHLAGFNRVQLRIPATSGYWPARGSTKIDDALLTQHLQNRELFHKWGDGGPGLVLPDMRLTLAFHGLFAIAHPNTWDKPIHVQAEHLISLCKLPIDYARVDDLLMQLGDLIEKRNLNARIVQNFVTNDRAMLRAYIESQEKAGHEGICIVQSGWDSQGKSVMMGPSVKIKKYETIDAALLGVYLHKMGNVVEENIASALVGLYDQNLRMYLPVTKVNLDPNGVQIKTEGQRQRLTLLRKEITSIAQSGNARWQFKSDKPAVHTLYDVFLMQGKIALGYLFGTASNDVKTQIEKVLETMPRGHDLISAFNMFEERDAEFTAAWVANKMKKGRVIDKFIFDNYAFFKAVQSLPEKSRKRFNWYFGQAKEIKRVSNKLVQPDIVIDTATPVILETQVFDIKWGTSPYPAGFHSWFGNSFCFNNSFAERIRHDKGTTTDYETVYVLARRFTVRKPKTTGRKRRR